MATATLSEILEGLSDNADFEEAASVTKAKAFVTWATRWLVIAPRSASNNGSSLTANAEQVNDLLKRARSYVAANDTSSATASRSNQLSVEYFRD